MEARTLHNSDPGKFGKAYFENGAVWYTRQELRKLFEQTAAVTKAAEQEKHDPTDEENSFLAMLKSDFFDQVKLATEACTKPGRVYKRDESKKYRRNLRRTKTQAQKRFLMVHCSEPKDQELLSLAKGHNDLMKKQLEEFKIFKKLVKEQSDGPLKARLLAYIDPLYRKSQHLGSDGAKRLIKSYIRARSNDLGRPMKLEVAMLGRKATFWLCPSKKATLTATEIAEKYRAKLERDLLKLRLEKFALETWQQAAHKFD